MKKQSDNKTQRLLTWVLLAVFFLNQYAISSVAAATGKKSALQMMMTLGVKEASAMTIMMPVLNDDGMTTILMEMPTITEVEGEPRTGDVVQDAMTVMIAKGAPFYAPDGVSFDDPVGALAVWSQYEKGIELSEALEDRYRRLIMLFPCNFCCGSPMNVTVNGRCGCAHARAARGFFRYMLNAYGDAYTDDQLFGEAYRWQAVWYPSGVVEDYLLATGRGSVLQHKTHGGAGQDGMHGIVN